MTFSENTMFFVAGSAIVVSHVFYQSNSRHLQIVEHFNSFHYIHVTQLLGSGHDDSRFQPQLLAESKLNVASTGREINNEKVEGAPVGLAD